MCRCGYSISLSLSDELPSCPACGGSHFRRASMFELPTVDADAIAPAPALPAWLDGVRADLAPGSLSVAFEEDDEPVVVELRMAGTGSVAAARPISSSTTRPCHAATR